ncbi:DNA/RNA non-specific endonuclease [Streptomyces sp. NRRL B-24484]|uniref:DNA/RNA non-specific endonuclease n=1 Tax=Streptomyces sp. NRRL B-24484 TaxID=1463833 RepID=UPI0006941563|nr:DNA/RNA non-specific endonuclease [Streptomyces sp. NRRL B-24484]
MTAPSRTAAARRRRTLPRILHLVLMALLAPIVAAGAQTITATDAVAVTAQAGTLAPVPLVAPRGFEAALATLLAEVEDANRQAAELAQQGKDVVAEAERITKESAAVRDSKAALNARVAAVNQEISGHDERAKALEGEIAAHNAKPNTFQMPAQAAAAAAFDAEARQLKAERDQENAVEDKIQGEESQIRQEASQVDARSSQLDAASKANDSKASALKTKEQQLQSRGQQLLAQMAQAIQSFSSVPSNPAAAMDQGGDAPAPAPQAGNRSAGQDEDTGDSPYRQPRAAALTQYAKQHGTTVDARPGTAYLTPDAVRRLSPAQAATLGSPAVSYDGLVRRPNGHYTALRVQMPSTATATGAAPAPAPVPDAFDSGGLVTHRNGEALAIDGITTLQESSLLAAPGPANPPPAASGRADCLTRPKGRPSGGGWILNTDKPVPSRNKTATAPSTVRTAPFRAEKAEACLTSPLGDGTPADGDIAGWEDAKLRSAYGSLARCHLIANILGGRGSNQGDWNNLVPCYQQGLNTKGISMVRYEKRVREEVKQLGQGSGFAVHYEVTPHYLHDDSTIPTAVTMTARVELPNGASWPVFYEIELENTPDGGGPNLGN